MGNYVRSVRELTAELKKTAQPQPETVPVEHDPNIEVARGTVPAAETPGTVVGVAPQPIAVVGVHGISPIQQYAFQDQLATGLLAYLNARDEIRFGTEYVARRCGTERRKGMARVRAGPDLRTGIQRRSGHDRRSGIERRAIVAPRSEKDRRKGERRRVQLRWAATPYWPRVSKRNDDPVLKPSALRLHLRTEHDPAEPTTQVYDIYEGYWSPFSKGKASLPTLLMWLLRCTFLATSATARIPASWSKLFWDMGYVFGALAVVLTFFVGAAFAGARTWTHFLALFEPDAQKTPTFLEFAANPFGKMNVLPWFAWLHLVLIVVLVYLLVQLAQLAWARWQGRRSKAELLADSGKAGRFRAQTIEAAKFHRAMASVFGVAVVSLAILDILVVGTNYAGDVTALVWDGAWLVVTVGLIQLGRWLAGFVVENILGDVQVYTTHDCNAAFYAVRQQIVSTVTNAMLGALNAIDVKVAANGDPQPQFDDDGVQLPDKPLYAKIHIAGHSLGSTIAVDVLLRVRQLTYEGAINEDSWGRVRSLTTFGTALEKTRFLLDVRNPTVSAAQQQWQNDAYGRFFTRSHATLGYADNTMGIYWTNHWYWKDVVANRIVSYKSVVKPGKMSFAWTADGKDRKICRNNLIPHPRWPGAFVHGDYIGDPEFWKAVGPVLTT